ncbi:MAG: DUF2339 domain-containing protein [Dethiobacteria bacterium]
MQDELRKLQEEVKALQEEQQKMGERLKVIYEWLALLDKRRPPQEAAFPTARADLPAALPPPPRRRKLCGLILPRRRPLPPLPPPSRGTSQDLEARIGGIWLNRIGVIVFLLGAAFFLKLAYDWGWINETVRIAIGAAAALILLWLGERNRRRGFTAYSQGLTGGGIALLYFTIFASFYYYDLLSSTTGMGLLILVTIGAVSLALYQNARAVAVIGLLTGFLNPALFVAEEPRFVLLMVYLIMLNLGILAVAYFKRWRFMGVISFILTNIFLAWVLAYRFQHPALALPAVATQVYFSIFLLLFLALPLITVSLGRRQLEFPELFLVIGGAVTYYGLSWFNLHPEFPGVMGWFTLGLAGFYLLAGFALLPAAQRAPQAHFTAFSLAAVLLVVFVPLQLHGAWILAGWTLEAALLCYLGLRLADQRIRGGFWVVLSLALFQLLYAVWTHHIDPGDYRFLLNSTALLTFGFIAVLLLLSWFYRRFRREGPEPSSEVFILAGAAGLLLLAFVSMDIYRYGTVLAWHTGNAEYYRNLALLMMSLFWALYAAVLMAFGFIRRQPPLRYAAIALFGLTLAKVILYDLSFLKLVYRIISLVALGLILLIVSYLYQRHRGRIDPAA